ncbi:hypothetical protein ACRAWF_44535 [Streptomyces sp. L7]
MTDYCAHFAGLGTIKVGHTQAVRKVPMMPIDLDDFTGSSAIRVAVPIRRWPCSAGAGAGRSSPRMGCACAADVNAIPLDIGRRRRSAGTPGSTTLLWQQCRCAASSAPAPAPVR